MLALAGILTAGGGAPSAAAAAAAASAARTKTEIQSGPIPETEKGAAVPMNSNCPNGWAGQDAATLGASWLYSWGPQPPLVDGIESVPMIWGAFSGCPELGGNSEWVLGFNEPDHAGQADMTPEEGASHWRQLEQCYPERKLVSPAVVFEPSWLETMREAYVAAYGEPPRFDALAFHCYDQRGFVSACQKDARQYLAWLDEWDVPGGLWLTEFGYVDTDRQAQVEKLRDIAAWVEQEPRIVRYAWFATRYDGDEAWAVPEAYSTALMTCESGEPTALGEAYMDLSLPKDFHLFVPLMRR